MAIINKLEQMTSEEATIAYDINYCALRKLTSEEKEEEAKLSWLEEICDISIPKKPDCDKRSRMFGGMTEAGIERCLKPKNAMFLAYREKDKLPVAAISFIGDENFQEYEELLDGTSPENIVILNSIAVRPELWGQGYGRLALKLAVEEMKQRGKTTFVFTMHPYNDACRKAILYTINQNKIVWSKPYIWSSPKGIERRRIRGMFKVN